MSIWRCSDFASYRRRGHFSHAGCEAYRLRSRPSLVSISPTASFTRRKQICGKFEAVPWKRIRGSPLDSLLLQRRAGGATLLSVCRRWQMWLETWEDVTSCCRRPCAHLTSACTLTGAAVFGDLLYVRKKRIILLFTKSFFSLRAKFWPRRLKERSLDFVGRLSCGGGQSLENISLLMVCLNARGESTKQ